MLFEGMQLHIQLCGAAAGEKFLCLGCQLGAKLLSDAVKRYIMSPSALNTQNSQQTLADRAAMKGSARHNETSMREEASWHSTCICRGFAGQPALPYFPVTSAVYKLFPKF